MRATRYEFNARSGCIVPATDAKMRAYDPWKLKERPYYGLLEIAKKHGRDALVLPDERPDVVASLLEWCNQFGLLGTLLHRVISVTFEPRWVYATVANSKARFLVPEQQTHVSLTSVWKVETIRHLRMLQRAKPGMLGVSVSAAELPTQSEPGVLLLDLPGIRSMGGLLKREHLAQTWMRHFPSLRLGDPYPQPMSAEFWKLYAEPVYEFADAAWIFANALDAIYHPAHDKAQGNGIMVLGELASRLTSTLELQPDGSLRQRLFATSLLSSLALMAMEDISGKQLHSCQTCGKFFSSGAYQAEYCSPKCRRTMQKRHSRERERRTTQPKHRKRKPAHRP